MSKTTNWVGQNLPLTIEKVAHGGIFVARHDGRVVFVSHVLPGEKVLAQVYEDRGGSFCRAEPVQILEASPDRVAQVWKQAGPGGAGGAEFGHIKLARQRELKADVLEEALDRVSAMLGHALDWTQLEAFLPPDAEPALRRSALASSFLAMLELAKQGRVELQQEANFGPLMVKSRAGAKA